MNGLRPPDGNRPFAVENLEGVVRRMCERAMTGTPDERAAWSLALAVIGEFRAGRVPWELWMRSLRMFERLAGSEETSPRLGEAVLYLASSCDMERRGLNGRAPRERARAAFRRLGSAPTEEATRVAQLLQETRSARLDPGGSRS